MTKKKENRMQSDLDLVMAATSRDSRMVDQVKRLLADGKIDEPMAKRMLEFVRDGYLRNDSATWYIPPIQPICTRPHYPTWPYQPTVWTQYPYGTSATITVTNGTVQPMLTSEQTG